MKMIRGNFQTRKRKNGRLQQTDGRTKHTHWGVKLKAFNKCVCVEREKEIVWRQ